MSRRALVSPRLPELRSGNSAIDQWVAQHLQPFVAEVFEKTKSLSPELGEFAPTWDGFDTDPVGNILYRDHGDSVELFADAALTGTSDEAFMLLTGLPGSLCPSADRYVRCFLLDESDLRGGVALVSDSGSIQFYLEEIAASPTDTIGFDSIFTDPSSLGLKGLPAGWQIRYTK